MTNPTTNNQGQATPVATEASHEPMPTAIASVMAATEQYRLALEPNNFNEAWRAAGIIAATGLCGVASQEEAFTRIMTGRALGLSTMASLRGIFVVEGKPGLEAKTKLALCLSHPEVVEYFRCVETTNEKARYVAKRHGSPEISFEYTIEMARQAGLVDRGKTDEAKKQNNWNKHPAAMLRARASSQLADIVAPDVTHGLPTRDELEEASVGVPLEVLPAVAKQAASMRDFDAEAVVLRDRVTAATTPELRKAVREDIAKFKADAPVFQSDAVIAHFNATAPKRGEQAAAAAPAPPKTDGPAQPSLPIGGAPAEKPA